MLARRAAEKGFAGVISDAGVGVLAAHSALRSAALNVYINAPALKDRAYATAAAAEVETLIQRCARESEAVFELVRGRLG
jgi:formiminotetrahydrofolate cyclodeaminase